MPADGQDVVIPEPWNLLLDISAASLGVLTIQGRLSFGESMYDSEASNLQSMQQELLATKLFTDWAIKSSHPPKHYFLHMCCLDLAYQSSWLGAHKNQGRKMLMVGVFVSDKAWSYEPAASLSRPLEVYRLETHQCRTKVKQTSL